MVVKARFLLLSNHRFTNCFSEFSTVAMIKNGVEGLTLNEKAYILKP